MTSPTGRVASIPWRRVANVVGVLVLLAVVGLFVASSVPQLVGADRAYVVESNSMSPAIEAGAVVFVAEVDAEAVGVDDVVTYERGASTVTHRVVDVLEDDGDRRFRTKGDANDAADPEPVAPSQLVGQVTFHVPLLGYGVAFAGTDLGLLALVVLPAAILVLLEIRAVVAGDGSGGDGK